MSGQYSRDHCKIAVAKILQTIGWHSINSTPLEVLTDILSRYVQQIGKIANEYSNQFGQTEPNLDHLGLAFQEMGINLGELEEYVTYVNFCPSASSVPKFPVPKENNLNFLKPGSKEVVTRPVHINEHLPPMYPLLEGPNNEETPSGVKEEIAIEEATLEDREQFKKPLDVISPEYRKLKKEEESGSRPTREISSVMMTTSGFLSPAREGKLPEAKAPAPPPAPDPPPVVAPPPVEPVMKKKIEKRKEPKVFKSAFKDRVIKRAPTIKDEIEKKLKEAAAAHAGPPHAISTSGAVTLTPIPVPQNIPLEPEVKTIPSMPINPKYFMKEKMDKALAAAKAKTEKLNTTITPIPFKSSSPIPIVFPPHVEKLHNEPDRKKVNIFRKISNVKESKSKKEGKNMGPMIIVDEATNIVNKITHLSSDITIEPINPMQMSKKMDWGFDDGSPPATPLTPKTPEIITSPIVVMEKRKRKDPMPKVKRPKKQPQLQVPAHFLEPDIIDSYGLFDRPKTPDAIWHHLNMKQAEIERKQNQNTLNFPPMGPPQLPFPFLANFGGPGLIPPQLTTPMFPFSQFGNMPNFGKNSYFASGNLGVNIPSSPSSRKTPPIGSPSPKMSDAVEIKPVEIIPQVQKSPQPPIQVPEASSSTNPQISPNEEDLSKQKNKEHKKEKKDKIKKKNKKDKEKKEKSEKKKLKELKKDEKEKVKKEKKIKKKGKLEKQEIPVVESPIPKILLKVNSPSPRPETPEHTKRLNIKPIVKSDEDLEMEEKKREPSPGGGLAKISALVTGPPKPKSTLSPTVVPPPAEKTVVEEPPAVPRTPGRPRLHPLKPKPPPKPKKIELPFKRIDEDGNEVWICPSCGHQDDGRPMIGCDGCDAWYHWVCVGIQVPPDADENWYCKPCLCKKNEDLQSDKKRKRKRKENKDH